MGSGKGAAAVGSAGVIAAGLTLGLAAAGASGQAVVSAEKLWATNCVSCHGERGQGGGAGTRTLLSDDLFGQEHDRPFFEAIKDGLPGQGMEPFGQTLSDRECWALVVHIRELQAREHRARVGDPKPVEGVYTSAHARFKVQTVIGRGTGLQVPWSVDFLPDGGMLVTERPGRLRVFRDGQLGEPVTGTPAVRNRGQGGLMDVAPHPRFADNGWIYLSYSDELVRSDRSTGFTKIVRGRIKDGEWVDQETVFEAKPEHYLPSDIHFGCRLVFRKPGAGERYELFFCTGERGHQEFARDLRRPNGKIHRVWEDGAVPEDNPFASREDAQKTVWSYGHRNPQGLVFDLEGRLWDTEHGPRGGDELNLIEKGADYGWPKVCFGINYNDAPFATPWPEEGDRIVMPVDRWLPSIAACGLDVVRGDAFPAWRGDLLAGGLAGQNVDRVRLSPGEHPRVLEREEIIHGMGRVRDVVCGPDGTIYIVLNDPDTVIRLVPAEGGDRPEGKGAAGARGER